MKTTTSTSSCDLFEPYLSEEEFYQLQLREQDLEGRLIGLEERKAAVEEDIFFVEQELQDVRGQLDLELERRESKPW